MFARYKHLWIVAGGIALAVVLGATGILHAFVDSLGQYGYAATFAFGLMFSSAAFAGVATVALFDLGQDLNPWAVAAIGGIGAMLGDLLWYRLFRSGVLDEVKNLFSGFHPGARLKNILNSKFAYYSLPVLASAIIVSPLPDELGIAMFAAMHFKRRKLAVLSFLLNAGGILAIVMLGAATG